MRTPVSSLLDEKYGIAIRPGGKGQCPFCNHNTFSLKRDDTLGKCFHPACGRLIIQGAYDRPRENKFHVVMEDVFHDFHQELLANADHHHCAHSYMVVERGIHPRVVADSMVGAVPAGYDVASRFDVLIEVARASLRLERTTNTSKTSGSEQEANLPLHRQVEFLTEARDKLQKCVRGSVGWIAFFYTDSHHRIVAIRFREPYSKRILYFKPYKAIAGLFGHGLFAQNQPEGRSSLEEFLITMEGEFNQLQLQSLTLRHGEVPRQNTGYVFACSVGGVNNTDYESIRKTSSRPVFCYDNDSNGAGFALVDGARKTMSVHAFTTPEPDSDMDQFIRSFGNDHTAAWEEVKSLVAGRDCFPRVYSGTGIEFFRGNTFIPKWLADAIMEQRHFRYTASVLWAYNDGVYRPHGEPVVRFEAQALLGEERRENRIVETLRFIEIATGVTAPDPNLAYINLRNGRLDWRTENLELHLPDIFEVVQLPVAYDPNAMCPHFDRYLETTLEPETIQLAEEIMGYCLIPDTRFEKAVMFTGCGANGKSVLLDTIAALLGNENVSAVALQDLEENRFRVAELYGKLTNIFADLDDRAMNSSSVFKTLVTGDRITAERKFSQPFSFRPYARLIFSANTLPSSKDRTPAFYRRWLIIPFDRIFEGANADKELRGKLRDELPGILNRALRGLQRLFSEGKFSEPQAVKAALKEYQRENDSVASFVAEHVVEGANETTAKQAFYGKYRYWCESQELRPVTEKQLKASLKRIFPMLDEVRSCGGKGPWHWVGIRLHENP